MFFQVRIANFLSQEFMMFVAAMAVFVLGILFFEFFQDTWRQLFVNDSLREPSDKYWPLDRHGIVLPPSESEQLLIKLVWKPFGPRKKLVGNVQRKQAVPIIARANI